LQHGEDILDRLAKVRVALEDRYLKWLENTSSTQLLYAPAPAPHSAPEQLIASLSILSHWCNYAIVLLNVFQIF
jgi:hypothetical protein